MSTTGEASTTSNKRAKREVETAEIMKLRDASYHALYENQISSKHILFRLQPEDIAIMALLSKRALEVCCSSTLFKDLLRCFFPYANVPFAKDHARNREAVLVFIQLARRRRPDPELLRVFINSRGTALYVGAQLRVQTRWPLPETRMKYVYRREKLSEGEESSLSARDVNSIDHENDDEDEDTNYDPTAPILRGPFTDNEGDADEYLAPRQLSWRERQRQEDEDAFFEPSDVDEVEQNDSTVPTTFVESGCFSNSVRSGGVYKMPVKFLNYNVDAMLGFTDIRNNYFVCRGEGPGVSGMAFDVMKMDNHIDFETKFEISFFEYYLYEERMHLICPTYLLADKGCIDEDGSVKSPSSTGYNIHSFDLHRLVRDKENVSGWKPQLMLADLRIEICSLSMDTEDKKLYLISDFNVITVDMSDENRLTYTTNELAHGDYRMLDRAFISGPLYVDTNNAGTVVTTIDFRNINAAGKIVVHRYHTRPLPGRRSFSRLVKRPHYPTMLLEYKQINGYHYPQFISRPMPWEERVPDKHK